MVIHTKIKLSADESLAFLADGINGLQIINVSDHSNIYPVGNYNTPGSGLSVALSPDESTAFIADGTHGLHIIDISTPSDPTLLSSINPSGNTSGASAYQVELSADGRKAFIADRASGIHVVDIRDLLNPILETSYDTAGLAFGLALSPNTNSVVVADGTDFSTGKMQIIGLNSVDSFSQDTDTVQITITAVDDPASISGVTEGIGVEDSIITGTLTANDDADGLNDGAYFSITSSPNNGSAAIDEESGEWALHTQSKLQR